MSEEYNLSFFLFHTFHLILCTKLSHSLSNTYTNIHTHSHTNRLTKRLALLKAVCCEYPYLLLLEDDVAIEGDLVTQIREIVTSNDNHQQINVKGSVGMCSLTLSLLIGIIFGYIFLLELRSDVVERREEEERVKTVG